MELMVRRSFNLTGLNCSQTPAVVLEAVEGRWKVRIDYTCLVVFPRNQLKAKIWRKDENVYPV